jgi:hypothetical protein
METVEQQACLGKGKHSSQEKQVFLCGTVKEFKKVKMAENNA